LRFYEERRKPCYRHRDESLATIAAAWRLIRQPPYFSGANIRRLNTALHSTYKGYYTLFFREIKDLFLLKSTIYAGIKKPLKIKGL